MTHVTFRKRRQRYGEKELENILRTILEAVPQKRIDDLIRGRIDRVDFTELVVSEMEEERLQLEEALYAIILFEVEETDDEVRDAINRNLRQLGSPVRLQKPKQIKKAQIDLIYQDWNSMAYDPFDVADPEAVLRVQARQQAGQIFSHLAATERDMIIRQVELGFTQVQEFSTGRTVTGRTVQQTARGIFPILETTIPVVTPETAAIYRTKYTNGLFPRWANAVNNFADRTANQLTKKGVTGNRAKELLDNRTKRYGDKLRRSRARMIARTETSFAQNAARQASYDAAIEGGLINDTATKTWVTGGFDVCNLCSPLAGRKVPLREVFYWAGGFRGGVGQTPPAHPNCRCKTRMDPNIGSPPQLMGTGTPADPFRYMFADGFTAGINPTLGVVQAYELAHGGMPYSHRRLSNELEIRKPKGAKESKRPEAIFNPVVQAMDEAGLSVKPIETGTGEALKTEVVFGPPKGSTHASYEARNWKSKQPRIDINGALGDDVTRIGHNQNSFAHEIGHRLDSRGYNYLNKEDDFGMYFINEAVEQASKIAGPNVEFTAIDVALLPEEYRAAVKLIQVAKNSNATVDLAARSSKEYFQYTQKPIEVWARAFNQWFTNNYGTPQMIDDMALATGQRIGTTVDEMRRHYNGFQWQPEEFEEIGKLVEEVLKVRGQLQ